MPETVVHFQIRMPPELHEKLCDRAKKHTVSINSLVVQALENALKKRQEEDLSDQKPQPKRKRSGWS